MQEEEVFSYLPPPLCRELREAYLRARKPHERISEVRLRVGHYASLTLGGKGASRNVVLPKSLGEKEVREIFARASGGSLYAVENSIKEGFLTTKGGIRVGICGRAVMSGKRIDSLSSLSSLVFRIAHHIPDAADALCGLFLRQRRGILLFSPPGGGKTTALRAFIRKVATGEGALRVSVVDTRGELSSFPENALVDVLSGYPKAQGAEIAVRTLSPEVLVMDELGGGEVESLLALSSLGVPVVASAHARDPRELMRGGLSRLWEEGVFASLWDVRANREAEPWDHGA